MSKLASPPEILDLLRQLRDAVRLFVAREDQLQREHQTQETRLGQRCEAVLAQRTAQLQAELAELEAVHAAERARLAARWDARLVRLQRAHRDVLRAHLTRLEERENQRKFDLQRELLAAQRQREAALKATSTTHAEFTAQLKAAQQSLADLEGRARSSLRGYAGWRQRLEASLVTAPAPAPGEADESLAALQQRLTATALEEERVRSTGLPMAFSYFPVWLWCVAVLGLVGVAWAVPVPGLPRLNLTLAGAAAGAGLAVVGLLYLTGWFSAGGAVKTLIQLLGECRQLSADGEQQAKERRQIDEQHIEAEAAAAGQRHEEGWNAALAETEAAKTEAKRVMEIRQQQAMQRYEWCRHRACDAFESVAGEQLAAARGRVDDELAQLAARNEASTLTAANQRELAWQALTAEWRAALEPVYGALGAVQHAAAAWFPEWSPAFARDWTPPAEFAQAAQFARLEVDVARLAGGQPRTSRLALPGPGNFFVPVALCLPRLGSLLIETKGEGREQAIGALNSAVLRLLSASPPGRLSFTLVDPVELGRSFSGLMHLADYDERLINNRIWTQPAQIEQQLATLNDHIEKVSQMYLRNEFATIADYNAQAGRIAERYHFLVVADFPANFSETAVRRLMSIAASGARCGVHTLLHWDQRKPVPQEFTPEELRAGSVCVRREGNAFVLGGEGLPGVALALEAVPAPEVATELLHKVGRASVDANRVQVPFSDIAPTTDAAWTLDTGDELRVPIGRTGATKLQYLCLGKGTRQHALVAGKTGSGKSTLFHVIITDLAMWCSPEQVEFYLVDFKKGVEFRCYAAHRLPHARVVAIESDREFGLSVLERLDEELKRRGEMFRKVGAQDLPGYRRASGAPLPRTLLLIDEFQEFFVADDRVAQGAALLLDRIVRQGRAFGIHVILGSQTLGGAYSLARATLGQMVVRIALQCNEADAALIMDDSNPAPRLLSRPGEAIYNDTAGSVEGNSPFQTVWIGDEERDQWLEKINSLTREKAIRPPGTVVFEGNAPADVRENALLAEALVAPAAAALPRAWLGAPNSIKGPTEAVFHRQSGNNLLFVGQREEAALAMLGVSLLALAAQGAGRLVLVEATAPDSPQKKFFEAVARAVPRQLILARAGDLDTVMAELAAELGRRTADESTPAAPWFVVVHELQKFKKLRHEEDFSYSTDETKPPAPGAVFDRVIREGPGVGLHVLCTCDSYNSLARALSRKAMSEFELRVLFQMSANDSASLCDSPKASDLGLHRALLHNGQLGVLETFRPYALPDAAWLEVAGNNLSKLAAG